jgi:reverse gyrase
MDAIEVGKASYEEILNELFHEFKREVLPHLTQAG